MQSLFRHKKIQILALTGFTAAFFLNIGAGIIINAAQTPASTILKNKTSIAPDLVSEETQLILLLDKVLPSVVNVVGIKEDDLKNIEVVSRGTGFIVDKKGIILTNRHVVSEDDVVYKVYFLDGRRYDATIASRDPLKDVALLKINDDNLPTLTLGDSDAVKIGQVAIAIGNSLGRYPNSVTKGIISGLGRSITASSDVGGQTENLEDVIQTDAEINLGNSGGPLLNSKGEAIGINTAIETIGRGLGFAVPINEAKKALQTYQKFGRIVRPYLGLRYLTITPDLQDEKKLSYDYGALVNAGSLPTGPAIIINGPADKAGILEGDIILAVNDKLVRGKSTLSKLVQSFAVGDKIRLKINRHGALIEVDVTLEEVGLDVLN